VNYPPCVSDIFALVGLSYLRQLFGKFGVVVILKIPANGTSGGTEFTGDLRLVLTLGEEDFGEFYCAFVYHEGPLLGV